MKKWIPALLCIALLISGAANIQGKASGQTGTTTSPTASTTTTTQSSQLEFDFVYENNNDIIRISWNANDANGLRVKLVKIGNKSKFVYDDSGEFSVDLVNDMQLPPGIYPITLEMDNGNGDIIESQKQVERAGQLQININLIEDNGYIAATVMDNYMRPVSDREVKLFIAGQLIEEIDPQYTDQNGYVVFPVSVPEDLSKVKCSVDSFTLLLENGGQIQYEGAEGGFPDNPPSTTSSPSTATTSRQTTATASKTRTKTQTTKKSVTTSPTGKQTLPIITGAGTTSIIGDMVAVNVSFDTGVLDKFGYSSKDFAARSRLLMNKTLYSNLVGGSSVSIMLLAQASSIDITDHHISAAISGKSKYSLYQAQQTLRIPLDLSMLIVDKQKGINTPVTMPESEVQIELPVPKSMRKSSEYTVVAAICDEEGITRFLETEIKDGTMRFTVNRLSSLVILGFDNSMGSGFSGGIPFLAIGIIVLGLLMLAGAGVLLYLFFIRRPIPQDAAEDEMSFFHPDSPYNLDTQKDGVSLSSLLEQDKDDQDK